jgi:acyl-CoA synthetase (AMP-forming)/AMP-acid ligase II
MPPRRWKPIASIPRKWAGSLRVNTPLTTPHLFMGDTAKVTQSKRADLVSGTRGLIPITTSGKVRRRACAERYRHGQFARLDV